MGAGHYESEAPVLIRFSLITMLVIGAMGCKGRQQTTLDSRLDDEVPQPVEELDDNVIVDGDEVCSDGSSDDEVVPPAPITALKSLTMKNADDTIDRVITLDYDDQGRLNVIEATDRLPFRTEVSYEDNQASFNIAVGGESPMAIQWLLDEQGRRKQIDFQNVGGIFGIKRATVSYADPIGDHPSGFWVFEDRDGSGSVDGWETLRPHTALHMTYNSEGKFIGSSTNQEPIDTITGADSRFAISYDLQGCIDIMDGYRPLAAGGEERNLRKDFDCTFTNGLLTRQEQYDVSAAEVRTLRESVDYDYDDQGRMVYAYRRRVVGASTIVKIYEYTYVDIPSSPRLFDLPLNAAMTGRVIDDAAVLLSLIYSQTGGGS